MAACAGLPAHTSWGGARHGAPGPRTVPAELSHLAPRPEKPPPVSPPVRKGGHDGCGVLRAAGARKARLEWAPPPSQGLSPSSAPQHGSAPAGRLSPARPCQGRALLLAPWSGQRTLYWWAAWWEPASQAKLGLGGLTWLLSLGTCPMVPTWGSVPLTKRPRLHPPSSQPRGLTHAEGPGDPEAGSLGPSSCPGMNGGTPPKGPLPHGHPAPVDWGGLSAWHHPPQGSRVLTVGVRGPGWGTIRLLPAAGGGDRRSLWGQSRGAGWEGGGGSSRLCTQAPPRPLPAVSNSPACFLPFSRKQAVGSGSPQGAGPGPSRPRW